AQTHALFSDLEIGAVKIGMLSQAATIEAVAEGLAAHHTKNIVLDPVMVATSGDRLRVPAAVEGLRKLLIPRALVVTPNLPEAAALTGASVARNEREMDVQARELVTLGARNVLIKGGHGSGDQSLDLLIGQGEVVRLSARRIATSNLHGTGCTLSSAIAAGLAKGLDLSAAAQDAKEYVTAAIAATDRLKIGHGHGPLHHFHAIWGAAWRPGEISPSVPPRRAFWPRRRLRARRRRNGAWSPPGRSGCRAQGCRRSASPSGSARSPAAGSSLPGAGRG